MSFILVVILIFSNCFTGYIINAVGTSISIKSAEEIYALSRILASASVKNNYIKSPTYDINNDFALFPIPNNVTSQNAKINYLATASFNLENDIAIELNVSKSQNFFLGIGSFSFPFKGSFNGNGKTVTLFAQNNLILDSNCDVGTGLFGNTSGAQISNLNVKINGQILVTHSNKNLNLGAIAGKVSKSKITDCNVYLGNAILGADYTGNEQNAAVSHIGAVVGFADKSIFTNCRVNMTNSQLIAKTTNLDTNMMYAMFSLGSIIGFSNPGSDNTNNIGSLGNQIYNCHLVSSNTVQQDIIAAYTNTSDELTVGGLVGCTFNNFVAKDCSVKVTRGNIIAKKSGNDDSASTYGTQAGGIIGRNEHTSELNNCSVNGDYLNIISISPNNQTSAGGIAGIDIGPIHRNIITLNNCKFNGGNTSIIKVEITTGGNARGKYIGAGGIVGYGRYKIIGCEAKNVNIINLCEGVLNRTYSGEIVGYYDNSFRPWASGTYFTPDTPEVNYNSSGINFIHSENVLLTLHNAVDNHIYTHFCDEICKECGGSRTALHYYDYSQDSTCNFCGFEREIPIIQPDNTSSNNTPSEDTTSKEPAKKEENSSHKTEKPSQNKETSSNNKTKAEAENSADTKASSPSETVSDKNGLINPNIENESQSNANIESLTSSITQNSSTPEINSYDVNNDGSIDENDLINLRKIIVMGITDLNTGDVNGDGKVNVCDLVRLKKHFAQN